MAKYTLAAGRILLAGRFIEAGDVVSLSAEDATRHRLAGCELPAVEPLESAEQPPVPAAPAVEGPKPKRRRPRRPKPAPTIEG